MTTASEVLWFVPGLFVGAVTMWWLSVWLLIDPMRKTLERYTDDILKERRQSWLVSFQDDDEEPK